MNGLPESQTLDVAQDANPIIGTEKRNEIPYGYCQCGCGNVAPLGICMAKKRGYFVGKPLRYIQGHQKSNFKTGEFLCTNGYYYVHRNGVRTKKCRYIVSQVLGKTLPKKSVVHHVDENTTNDKNTNFVLCDSQKYHFLIHKRLRALKACGNANWVKCRICFNYDDPINLSISKGHEYHKKCAAKYQRDRKDRISREELEKVVGFS